MKFLGDAVKEAFGPKTSIISALQKNLAVPLPERSHKTIHASDLTKENFCPRLIALLDITGQERKASKIPAAMKVTFDVGEMTADLMREKWMVNHSIGDWECLKCSKKVLFSKKPDAIGCSVGELHIWKYREIRFHDSRYDYSGGLDCLFDLGAPKLTVIELKIKAPEEFAKLVAPEAEHRIRTNLYLNLVEYSSHPHKDKINTQWAKILYVSRGYGKKNDAAGETLPFKEFDIERNDTDLSLAFSRATQVKLWRDKGVMPGHVCKVSFCPEAKSCQMLEHCFSGKYPTGSISKVISPLQSKANGTSILNTPKPAT